MGQTPRLVDLLLDHNLVDKVRPGDRVQMVGVYCALSNALSGQTLGIFPMVVLVKNARILERDLYSRVFIPNDVRIIFSLGKRKSILDMLGLSICPSIHGHEVTKKVLVLLLLSCCQKNLANGTHVRGDINIIMVGNPSTVKNQLLRSDTVIAPPRGQHHGQGVLRQGSHGGCHLQPHDKGTAP